MRRLSLRALATMTLLTFLPATPALAQAATTGFEDDWQFAVAPYLWATGIKGETTMGRLRVPIDLSFGDLVDKLDFAFAFHVVGKKGPWGIDLDLSIIDLGADLTDQLPEIPIPDARLKMDFDIIMFETFGNYRIGEERKWVEFLAGIRYMKMKNTLELTRTERIPIDESWTDVMGGLRAKVDLGHKFILVGRGDVSAGGSDLTYNLHVGLAFKISRRWSLLAEYRYLKIDYKNGNEGADFFAIDASMKGPLLGVGFVF